MMQKASSCMSLLALLIGMVILIVVFFMVISTPMDFNVRIGALGAIALLMIFAIKALGND